MAIQLEAITFDTAKPPKPLGIPALDEVRIVQALARHVFSEQPEAQRELLRGFLPHTSIGQLLWQRVVLNSKVFCLDLPDVTFMDVKMQGISVRGNVAGFSVASIELERNKPPLVETLIKITDSEAVVLSGQDIDLHTPGRSYTPVLAVGENAIYIPVSSIIPGNNSIL